MDPKGQIVKKGFNPDVDSYSAFFDNKKLGKTNMEELIREKDVTDLYICGIATDVCVGNTRFSLTRFPQNIFPSIHSFPQPGAWVPNHLGGGRQQRNPGEILLYFQFPHCQIQVQSYYSFHIV